MRDHDLGLGPIQRPSLGPAPRRLWSRRAAVGLAQAVLAVASSGVLAQQRLTPPMPDLTGVLNTATTDGKTGLQWAMILGKALFWDQQTGSDGVACASCHYSAGADLRLTNQLSPGAKDVTKGSAGDTQFGSNRSDTGGVLPGTLPSGAVAGANATLKSTDFPLLRLSDEFSRNSAVVTSTNDVVSSQGAFHAPFTSVNATTGAETCGTAQADVYHVGTLAARQVAARNSPTVINAVFNRRTGWDGAANNMFNGVGSFGMRDIAGDPNKRLIVLNSSSLPELGFLQLSNASLASQAVVPPVSSVEMSCEGRKLADLGRKLMATGLRPLAKQGVATTDSVLGGLADASGLGLSSTHGYAALVKRAFDPKYWNAAGRFSISNGTLTKVAGKAGYSQMEQNWSMFWGVSILLYESTLISATTEFDGLVTSGQLVVRDIRTGPPFGCTAVGTVDPMVLRGCQIFFQARGVASTPPGGGCNGCHGGKDLFTNASIQPQQSTSPMTQLGTVLAPGPGPADLGFLNTGVRPTFTDEKIGGVDPYGHPLSYSRQYMNYVKGLAAGETPEQALAKYILDPDLQRDVLANNLFVGLSIPPTPETKVHVHGAAKTPTMRNVALTPPYTSSGMFSNLRQMVKFYNRQTNRRDITAAGDPDAMGTACTSGDSSGSGADGNRTYAELQQTAQDCNSNIVVGVGELGLLDCDLAGTGCDPATDDIAAVVRFLRSLTDLRVQCDIAPFDHPSLKVTVGHRATDRNADGRADDLTFDLPAVGAAGFDPSTGLCIPNAGDLFAPGMQGRAGGAKVPLVR